MNHKPGDKVLVVEDCRPGGQATGQIGTYEGDFPLTIALNDGFEWIGGEYPFDDYMNGNLPLGSGRQTKDAYPLWEKGTPKPAGPFAMPMDNPRIRLEDGSVIWGCQCWWGDAATAPATLEEAQADLEKTKATLRGMIEACHAMELVREGAGDGL